MLHHHRLFVLFLVSVWAIPLAAPEAVRAQSLSLDPTSVTTLPPPPAGPCGANFSPDGDIFDVLQSLPMGPPGCGLGWAGPPAPANVDAFSSGLGVLSMGPLPLPIPPGFATVRFSVDKLATGDTRATCSTVSPGLLPPDVGSESCNLFLGGDDDHTERQSTDAADDIYSTAPNSAPLGLGPVAGQMLPHYQVDDGDSYPALGCPFTPALNGYPFTEPSLELSNTPGTQPIDDVDAYDANGPAVGPIAFDAVPADGIGDYPLYYSVDPPTAAACACGSAPDDVYVAIGGAASLYASGAALGLPPGNDVDGLAVYDVALDGVYAPGVDVILYSLSTVSPTTAALDCHGVAIDPGDILTEGTALGFPGVPCIVIDSSELGLWKSTCGVNPVTGLADGDNLDAFDLTFPVAPPLPLCGPTPEPDGACNLADVSGLGKSSLTIKDENLGVPDSKNQISWKWEKGVATTGGDFQNPVGGTSTYRFCIYDSSAAPQPIYQKDVLPNTLALDCDGDPCWQASGNPVKSYRYKSKGLRETGGVSRVSFNSNSTNGMSKLRFRAKGRYTNPPLTAGIVEAPNVVVQLLVFDGVTKECFKTTFPASGVKKQNTTRFIIKGP